MMISYSLIKQNALPSYYVFVQSVAIVGLLLALVVNFVSINTLLLGDMTVDEYIISISDSPETHLASMLNTFVDTLYYISLTILMVCIIPSAARIIGIPVFNLFDSQYLKTNTGSLVLNIIGTSFFIMLLFFFLVGGSLFALSIKVVFSDLILGGQSVSDVVSGTIEVGYENNIREFFTQLDQAVKLVTPNFSYVIGVPFILGIIFTFIEEVILKPLQNK